MEEKYSKYHYHVEDGQFSFDIELSYLLGKVGDIIDLGVDGIGDDNKTEIISIMGNYVECIGSVSNESGE